MKKILLGLLVIAMVLALTACSQETYAKWAENMGKMGNNVYGIEANMADVDKATEAVSNSVSVTVDEVSERKSLTVQLSAQSNEPEPDDEEDGSAEGSGTQTQTGSTGMPFTDVPEDEYYYEAVKWAVDSKITTGTTEISSSVM